MPIEAAILQHAPVPAVACPLCNVFPLRVRMRGQVQRAKTGFYITPTFPWVWFGPRLYCAIICNDCWMQVGWEAPSSDDYNRYHESQRVKKAANKP